MMLKIGALLASLLGFIIALVFARKEGKKSEQVANLRRELERQAKEWERAQNIIDNVRNMSDDDVAGRLQNLSGKQR